LPGRDSLPPRLYRGAMSAVALDQLTGQLQVRLLHPAARPPARAHEHDAGHDLACVEDFTLWPGQRRMVGTGVAIALPPGVAGLVTPRSGLAAKHGITVVNAPGLVDPGYRGELRVTLLNTGDQPFAATAGDRIAQLLLVPFVAPAVHVVEELDDGPDDRGELGFGSSGR
jgi:dUTP pyrophosphatase